MLFCNMLALKYTTLELVISVISAKLLLEPFNLQFRLHTSISREPWAKLWYCLRALDQPACGYYEIPIELAEALTGSDEKTIYRWLQTGKKKGAFRRCEVRRGILKVWLGGLTAVCVGLNCKNWGAGAGGNLRDLGSIRELTTATATQFLQQGSRYAANSALKKQYRKIYGAPHPNELLPKNQQSSHQSATGQVPFLLHVSESKVFVSKSFTAFGTSQHAISCELGIHIRTVQRHQSAAGMVKRQLCQSKVEYAQLSRSLENDVLEAWTTTEGIPNKNLGYQTIGDVTTFFDGRVPGAKKSTQWQMPAGNLGRRFFAIGGKSKKWFMAKCNIYREDMELTTMRASRKAFRHRLDQLAQRECDRCQKNRAGRHSGRFKNSPASTGI